MVGLGKAVEAITNGNQTLLAVMGRVSAIGEQNTQSSQGLANGSDGLLRAIEELSAIAEENSAAAEQVAVSTAEVGSHDRMAALSAHELMTMANGLHELVGMFVLKPVATKHQNEKVGEAPPANFAMLPPESRWFAQAVPTTGYSHTATNSNGKLR